LSAKSTKKEEEDNHEEHEGHKKEGPRPSFSGFLLYLFSSFVPFAVKFFFFLLS
jgi:heme/copper-type cytochrome/quinol oxidase subunit 3